MKANELRIGNYFYPINRDGDVHLPQEIEFIISEITQRNVKSFLLANPSYQLLTYNIFSIRDISPIPLTEEWLIRFGFNLDLNSELYNKSGFDVELLNRGVEFYLGEYGSYFLYVEHVHQLQNLYFSLTGQELTLKK